MGNCIISTVQQQVKIFDTPLEYQTTIFRFLEMAQAKQAKLVILPALSSLMLIPPLASRTKLNQLKKQQETKGKVSSFVSKLFGQNRSTAALEIEGIKDDLIRLLDHYPGEIYDAYIDLFSAAALKYQTTIVAGSFYLREHENAERAHVSYVFGPNGMVLGRQEKIHLTDHEKDFCKAGSVLQVIETSVGKIGILIEEDALYPECGRILAYNGVELIINLTACVSQPVYNQMRHAFLARVDENGLLGAQSCLVGQNLFEPTGPQLVGKAALLQPFQLSTYGDGIIFEVGSANLDGFIAEPISMDDLKDYWAQSSLRLRQEMQMTTYQSLSTIYRDQRTLDQVYWNPSGDAKPTNPALKPTPHSELSPLTFPKMDQKSEADILTSPFAQDDDE